MRRCAAAAREAEGLQAKNAAENSLSPEAMALRQSLALIGELSRVIEASVKPMENIDSIRIIQAGGAFGGTSDGGEASNGIDGIVNGALKFRSQAPLVDHVIQSIGLGDGLSDLVTKGATGLAGKAFPTPVKDSGAET